MASGYIKTIACGNLGRDAELRAVGDTSVANFSVACSEKWRDKNGDEKEHTEWVNCQLWGKRGEALAQYLTKGSRVMVEGVPRTREYEKDGKTRRATDLNVKEIVLLGGNRDGAQGGQGGGSRGNDAPPPADDYGPGAGGGGGSFGTDDIPFAPVDERCD